MADGAVANFGADMLSSIPADVMAEFNNVSDTPETGDTVDTTTEITGPEPIETGEPEPEPEPEVEPEPEAEPEPSEPEQPKQGAATDELPEGVTAGKNRKGDEGVFVRSNRWDNLYSQHKMVQEISDVIGEPLTKEAISLRDQAYVAQEQMFMDLESGDPGSQAKVLDFILDQLSEARQIGRTGTDPLTPLAATFYDRLQAKAPEAYAALRGRAARDLATELFRDAARSGDKNLFLSAQHVARWLTQSPDGDPAQIRAVAERMGVPFHVMDEMEGLARGADPLTEAQRTIQSLQQQLNGRQASTAAEQWQSWQAETGNVVRKGILDEAVKPALASIEQAWKPFQKDYDELVVKRLADAVKNTLANDPTLDAKIRNLTTQAQRATNPQLRAQLRDQIRQAYVNRAKQAADAHRREVIDFASQSLKGRVDSNHGRRQAAQTRTAPKGSTAPVPRSLVPDSVLKPGVNEVFDPNKAMKLAMSLING